MSNQEGYFSLEFILAFVLVGFMFELLNLEAALVHQSLAKLTLVLTEVHS